MGWFEPKIFILAEDNNWSNQLKQEFQHKALINVTDYSSIIDCLTTSNLKPDIVFVEHRMNHIDGIRASRMMKRKWRRTRIILMGASLNAQNKLNKRKYGINRILLRTENCDDFILEARRLKLIKQLKIWMFSSAIIFLSAAILFLNY